MQATQDIQKIKRVKKLGRHPKLTELIEIE